MVNQKKTNRKEVPVGFTYSRYFRVKISLSQMVGMIETKQGIWENNFQVKHFTYKAKILFYQVFHQSSKLDCFYDLFKSTVYFL